MTGSVGFISPTQEQLFNAWADFTGEQLIMNSLYQDRNILPSKYSAEIDDDAISRVTEILKQAIDTNPDNIANMLGQLVSETKPSLSDTIQAPEQKIKSDQLALTIQSLDCLQHPCLRLFYSITRDRNKILVFANGETFELAYHLLEFIQTLCDSRFFPAGTFQPWINHSEVTDFLTILYNRGYLVENE